MSHPCKQRRRHPGLGVGANPFRRLPESVLPCGHPEIRLWTLLTPPMANRIPPVNKIVSACEQS